MNLRQLRSYGMNLRQLRSYGMNLRQLRSCGMNLGQLRSCGMNLRQLRSYGMNSLSLGRIMLSIIAISAAGTMPEPPKMYFSHWGMKFCTALVAPMP